MPALQAINNKNGHAFEYAIALAYFDKLTAMGVRASIVRDEAFNVAFSCYDSFDLRTQNKFYHAAEETVDTLVKIEPGLTAPMVRNDFLSIRIAKDAEGQAGDVRDVIFRRSHPAWEIGFSAKNNNDAVKHQRLSQTIDFGREWVGIPCTQHYWHEIRPIFDFINSRIAADPGTSWNDLGQDKVDKIYIPLLAAFRNEVLRLSQQDSTFPAKLVSYLVGKYPFYKIIKEDNSNLVIVKAFNIEGQLNKTVNGKRSQYKIPEISLPTRIIEFEPMRGKEDNTLAMVLDGGWEISFRIHNAATRLERSLKFDVRLLGNPPILFSQYLFQ